MHPTKKLQVTLTILTVGLVALIFFLGKNNPTALAPEGEEEGSQSPEPIETSMGSGDASSVNLEGSLDAAVASERSDLTKQRKETLDSLDALFSEGNLDSASYYMAYAQEFEAAGQRIGAATYYQQLAEHKSNEANWEKAGSNYFKAQNRVDEPEMFALVVERTIHAFEKVMTHNPQNLDVKADLAITYFERQGENPMKGIGLLREITQVDPEHEQAIYYLAMLSMRSGQYDRARERMEKLVELQPDKPFNYYYLGQIYRNEGQNEKAISAFEEYRSRVIDPALQQQATRMIEQIKENL